MEDAPDWLLDIIAYHQAPSSRSVSSISRTTLDGFPEGSRNDGVFRVACRQRHRDLPYDEAKILILSAVNACTPPLPESEAIQCLDSAYTRYVPGTRRPLTELVNAERLVDRYRSGIRFTPEFNSWMCWENGSWVFDGLGKINQLAKEVIRGIHHEATEEQSSDMR
ncbi:MAG: primase C-terminal domain-containing protein, partial [Gammaproteobacteria bacterium]